MATYLVSGIIFTSKEALEGAVQHILHNTIGRLDPDDEQFIYDLLQMHPRADAKIGAGVREIQIRRGWRGGPMFIVVRRDGTETDFSYKKCIRPVTHATMVKAAFREAIAYQVSSIKTAHFKARADRDGRVACPITHELIAWQEAHVDHIPPDTFQSLLGRFLIDRDLALDNIALIPGYRGEGYQLPPDIAAEWTVWHQQHARLRVISAFANIHLVK